MEYDLAWFEAHPLGQRFAGLSQDVYDFALNLAESELKCVKKNCPTLYANALAIKLSLVIESTVQPDGTVSAGGSNTGGKVAYVIEDQVYDTKRKYELVDASASVQTSSPASMLESILKKCRAPLIGATLVRSFNSPVSGCGCFDAGYGDKSGGW